MIRGFKNCRFARCERIRFIWSVGPQRSVIAFVHALILVIPATSWAGSLTYSLIDLGDLPGGVSRSHAYGLNNLGHVVGESSAATGIRAFLWTPEGGMQNLGDLPGGPDWSVARDINDSGMVVGTSGATSRDTNERGFFWTAENGIQDLGVLPGGYLDNFSRGRAINNVGEIAGRSGWAPNPGGHAYIKPSIGDMVRLPDIPGGLDGSDAYDMNEFGSVVGYGHAPGNIFRAVLWSPTHGFVDLGDFPGGAEDSRASGVNDFEDVVGYGIDEFGRNRAYIWSFDEGMQDLGEINGLSASWIFARDINNNRQIVGHIGNQAIGETAFLWTPDGGMVDLNTLLDESGAGWHLNVATAINEQGKIVGYGVRPGESFINDTKRAFLLTPQFIESVPEPSALTLLLCAAGIGLWINAARFINAGDVGYRLGGSRSRTRRPSCHSRAYGNPETSPHEPAVVRCSDS